MPAAPVMANWEAASDPQLALSRFWMENVYPIGYQRWEGVPWRLSETSVRMRRPAPRLAEHHDEILRKLLGPAPEEIARLRASGVIADQPDNTEMFSTPSQAGLLGRACSAQERHRSSAKGIRLSGYHA